MPVGAGTVLSSASSLALLRVRAAPRGATPTPCSPGKAHPSPASSGPGVSPAAGGRWRTRCSGTGPSARTRSA